MKIGIIGYRNHARRLLSIINDNTICSKFIVYYPDNSTINDGFDSTGLRSAFTLTSDIQQLYSTDCVFIASPTETHFNYVKMFSLNFKGYIFCEKPPCSTVEELDQLNSFGDNEKSRIYFNLNYRFSALSQLIKKFQKTGEFGQLISMQFNSSHGLACRHSYASNWRNNTSSKLENIIGNVGIHYIDLVSYLFGSIKDVSIYSSKVSKQSINPDNALIVVTSGMTLPVSIYLSYSAPFNNSAIVIFSNAIIELRNGVITVQSPRDVVDKDSGMFCPAKIKNIVNFSSSREYYDDALIKSVENFIRHVECCENIPIESFGSALDATSRILNIKI